MRRRRVAPRRVRGDPAAFVLLIPQLVPDVYVNVVSRAAVYGIVALSMNIARRLHRPGVARPRRVPRRRRVRVGLRAQRTRDALRRRRGRRRVAAGWPRSCSAASPCASPACTSRSSRSRSGSSPRRRCSTSARSPVAAPARPRRGRRSFSGDVAYAYLCIGVLVLVLVFDWRLVASRAGPRHPGAARRRARRGVVGHQRHRLQAAGVRDLRRHRRHRRRAVRLDRADRVEGRLRAQPVDHVPA